MKKIIFFIILLLPFISRSQEVQRIIVDSSLAIPADTNSLHITVPPGRAGMLAYVISGTDTVLCLWNGSYWVPYQTANYVNKKIDTGINGTINYIPKFTGSHTIGNSLLFDTGSAIGLNTLTPSYNLDVIGTSRARDGVFMGNNARIYKISDDTTGTHPAFKVGTQSSSPFFGYSLADENGGGMFADTTATGRGEHWGNIDITFAGNIESTNAEVSLNAQNVDGTQQMQFEAGYQIADVNYGQLGGSIERWWGPTSTFPYEQDFYSDSLMFQAIPGGTRQMILSESRTDYMNLFTNGIQAAYYKGGSVAERTMMDSSDMTFNRNPLTATNFTSAGYGWQFHHSKGTAGADSLNLELYNPDGTLNNTDVIKFISNNGITINSNLTDVLSVNALINFQPNGNTSLGGYFGYSNSQAGMDLHNNASGKDFLMNDNGTSQIYATTFTIRSIASIVGFVPGTPTDSFYVKHGSNIGTLASTAFSPIADSSQWTAITAGTFYNKDSALIQTTYQSNIIPVSTSLSAETRTAQTTPAAGISFTGLSSADEMDNAAKLTTDSSKDHFAGFISQFTNFDSTGTEFVGQSAAFIPLVRYFGSANYTNGAAIKIPYPYTFSNGRFKSFTGILNSYAAIDLQAPTSNPVTPEAVYGILQQSTDTNKLAGIIKFPAYYQNDTTVTANTTMTVQFGIWAGNTTAGSFTLTLPAIVQSLAFNNNHKATIEFTIVNIGTTSLNTLTIVPNGADPAALINSASTFVLNSITKTVHGVKIFTDGVNWWTTD